MSEQYREHVPVSLVLPGLEAGLPLRDSSFKSFLPLAVKILTCKPSPVYGWNPLRWLLGCPKRWEITYSFEIRPNAR